MLEGEQPIRCYSRSITILVSLTIVVVVHSETRLFQSRTRLCTDEYVEVTLAVSAPVGAGFLLDRNIDTLPIQKAILINESSRPLIAVITLRRDSVSCP